MLKEYIEDSIPIKDIAKRFKVDVSSVYKSCKKHNISLKKRVSVKHTNYKCPKCGVIFHVSNYLPYCNNCGNIHIGVKSAVFLDNNSKLGNRIKELRLLNKSYSEISSIIGCSRSTVSYYCSIKSREDNQKRHQIYRRTFIGSFCSKISNFSCRKINSNHRLSMCLD